jgi:hypothetical protein
VGDNSITICKARSTIQPNKVGYTKKMPNVLFDLVLGCSLIMVIVQKEERFAINVP